MQFQSPRADSSELLHLTPHESVTVRERGPDRLVVEAIYAPGGSPTPAHFHPDQDERFEVTAGRLSVRLAGKERVLGPGDVLDVPRGEDRDAAAHSAFTPAASLPTDSFASPNSITVFGFRKSGFSMPAKPGLIERFSTTIACDWSTFRIGIP